MIMEPGASGALVARLTQRQFSQLLPAPSGPECLYFLFSIVSIFFPYFKESVKNHKYLKLNYLTYRFSMIQTGLMTLRRIQISSAASAGTISKKKNNC